MRIGNELYTRSEVLERVANINQLGGTRHYVLSEGRSKGVAAIDVDTGAGLRFTVLADRGMDISSASYKSTNLVYLSPTGEVHPAFYEPEGSGWLRTFFGGLLTTCGLTYLGPAGMDGDELLGLHGRHSTSPASRVCDRSRWDKDEYLLEICGVVEECALFGDNIRLTRVVDSHLGGKSLAICDIVENFGHRSSPLTVLYHVNLGFPLLDAESQLIITALESSPYNEHSRECMAGMLSFSPPIKSAEEEFFLHRVGADTDGWGDAILINWKLGSGLALYVRFDARALPYLNEWKLMGQGNYVVGIEPSNAPCENRAVLREKGLLPIMAPGETKTFRVEIGVLEGPTEIEAFTNRLGGARATG